MLPDPIDGSGSLADRGRVPWGSRPFVGSSKTSTAGSPSIAAASPSRGREDAQVVERGAAGVVAGRLEHRADVPDRVKQLVVTLAGEGGGARSRGHEPEQHPQGRRLAGAVGSEERRDRPGLDQRIDAVDRSNRAQR
jgi:hypothetical protein